MLQPKTIQNKYSLLLFTLILLFIIGPFFTGIIGQIVTELLFFGIILSIIRTFNLPKKNFFLYVGLAGLAFFFNIISDIYILSQGLESNFDKLLILISDLINSVFIILALLSINKKLFLIQKVNNNIIRGGIAVFLLIGLLWTFIYHIIFLLDPNAFSYSRELQELQEEYNYLFYFSFTTLTTLGYGDVTPINQFAMNLTNLEAIVGMMYPSIFIARLVSLYTADELKERN
ncbi:Ion transport 2 domain protein [Stanieria sp. NIES-3757]|nr:Ion transport 2 domain protein [Stanieria sp. NIES-3757]